MQGALSGGMPSSEGCSPNTNLFRATHPKPVQSHTERYLLALALCRKRHSEHIGLGCFDNAISVGKIFVMRFCPLFAKILVTWQAEPTGIGRLTGRARGATLRG